MSAQKPILQIYKRPAERFDVTLDFTPVLAGSTIQSITSAAAVDLDTGGAAAGIVAGSAISANVNVVVEIQAGTAGKRYRIDILVASAAGKALQGEIWLDVIAWDRFQQGVAHRIQDSAGHLSIPAIVGCVQKALKGRYTQARPLAKIKDFAGDGIVFEYEINTTNFPDWVDDASFFRSLEYPAGEKVPVYLDGDEWGVVRISSTSKKLRLFTTVPATGKTLRIEYSSPHKEDGSTVPDVDFEAVCDLAAAYACTALAAVYNQLVAQVYSAPSDGAHQTKSQHYLALAKKYEGQFEAALGLDGETKQPAATGWVEWESPLAEGSPKLTH